MGLRSIIFPSRFTPETIENRRMTGIAQMETFRMYTESVPITPESAAQDEKYIKELKANWSQNAKLLERWARDGATSRAIRESDDFGSTS
jgi:hypothetical protein